MAERAALKNSQMVIRLKEVHTSQHTHLHPGPRTYTPVEKKKRKKKEKKKTGVCSGDGHIT